MGFAQQKSMKLLTKLTMLLGWKFSSLGDKHIKIITVECVSLLDHDDNAVYVTWEQVIFSHEYSFERLLSNLTMVAGTKMEFPIKRVSRNQMEQTAICTAGSSNK